MATRRPGSSARRSGEQAASGSGASRGGSRREPSCTRAYRVEGRHEEERVTTLLELVAAVAEVARTDAEVIATVAHMIRSRRMTPARPESSRALVLAATSSSSSIALVHA